MKTLAAILVLWFILAGSVHAQSDVAINPNYTWNGEISLTGNPIDRRVLVSAWMKLTTLSKVSIAISRSTDMGNTWSAPVYMPHFSTSFTSADPTLAVSSDGTLYFAYIDYDNLSLSAGGVYVTRSTDGGITWTDPVKAIDASASADVPIDRPWLIVDNSGGPHHGNLYIVTKSIKEATVQHHIWFMSSSDNGSTWSTPKILDEAMPVGGTANTMGVPCISANSTLYVNYLSFDITQSLHVRDVYVRSNDGGQHFSAGVISELPFTSVIPPDDSLYQYSYHLAANPVDSGNLVHIITDRRDGDWDIWYNVTHDGGSTWSETTRLNDDPVGNGIGQDMCWGGFSANGSYAALWRDRRDGTQGQTSDYRIYGAASADGGNSFGANFALSSTLSPLSIPVTGNDFLGVALSDTLVFGAWADKRTGLNQEYCNRHTLPAVTDVSDLRDSQTERMIPPVVGREQTEISHSFLLGIRHYSVSVCDISGRVVLYQEDNPHLDLLKKTSGIYLLDFRSVDKNQREKFILK
jgi:hypothetical protein